MYFGTRLVVLAFGAALLPNLATAQQDPYVSRYTAMSALRIQEAESEENDSLKAASYREALEAILDGLAEDSDNPEAFLHLGIVQIGLSDYAAADSAFDQAEVLYPDYVDEPSGTGAYRHNGWFKAYNAAEERMNAEDLEGALAYYRSANLLYDKRPEAYLNIGSQTANLGQLDESIAAWEGAIAAIENPDSDPGDDETRVTWDTQFWSMAHFNLGQVLDMAGRSEEAIPIYERLLEREPDHIQARGSLALALSQAGLGDDALSIFDEILARDDATPLDYFNAGVSLYMAEQTERAVTGFRKALERAPMYRDALQNLVQTLAILGDFEAQMPYSERLLELDPYNDYIFQIHVRALSELGLQTELVAAIAALEGLPFAIDNLQLQPMGSGASIAGVAMNKTLDPGTSITLRFTFYDSEGDSLGSEDTEIQLSDPDVAHSFDLSFDSEQQVLGYSYEFVN